MAKKTTKVDSTKAKKTTKVDSAKVKKTTRVDGANAKKVDVVKVEGVTLTIDGQGLTVPRGTTLLEAAQGAGVEVPHYCYHPGLSSPAMCRLCLVEVEGAPKLLPSCTYRRCFEELSEVITEAYPRLENHLDRLDTPRKGRER